MNKRAAKPARRRAHVSPSDPYSVMSEFQIQSALFAAYQARGVNNGTVMMFAVPNGGTRRDAIEGRNMKRAGVRAGAPDVLAFVDGRAYAIELKKVGGKCSKDQTRMHVELEEAGVTVLVCYGYLEAVTALEGIGVLMRPYVKKNAAATNLLAEEAIIASTL
jgi:hypothetical protein